jgi:hypothetical protein
MIGAAVAVTAMGMAARTARADDAKPVTDATLRWEGSLGGTIVYDPLAGGSFDGGGVGGSYGVRTHRWGAFADYRLASIEWMPPTGGGAATYAAAGVGAPVSKYGVGGHMQWLGVAGRANLLSLGEHDADGMLHEFFELFVEAGAGEQLIGWHDGGSLTRGEVVVGGGVKLYGVRIRHDRTVGLLLRIDETLGRRDDGYSTAVGCAGPCDMATRPSSLDIGMVGMLTVVVTD